MSIEAGAPRARVAFTEFRSAEDPLLLAWVRFRGILTSRRADGFATAPPLPVAKQQSGLWRLLAPNNRELGRSFLLYSRFEAAREHIEQLQAEPETLTIDYIPGPKNGSRGWVVSAGDAPVMTCSRWYASLSTGVAAGDGALEAFRGAQLTGLPDRSSPSGRRFRRPSPEMSDART